jgi:hypothetical protein
VADADVISTFWVGTMCRTLVHVLDREQLKTTKDLLEIATQHASSEETVGAAFVLGNAKASASGGQVAPSTATTKGVKKGAKGG